MGKIDQLGWFERYFYVKIKINCNYNVLYDYYLVCVV